MPNKNPKLQVIVPESTKATVARLAALRQTSESAIVREFLVEVEPVMRRIAGLMEHAQRSTSKFQADFLEQLEHAQGRIEVSALDAMDVLEDLRPPNPKRRRAKAAPRKTATKRKPNPPTSNRGVTPTKPKRRAAKS